jgi:hypothetical protein
VLRLPEPPWERRADGQHQPPAGEQVDGGERLRRLHRPAQHGQQGGRAEDHAAGGRRDGGQHGQRLDPGRQQGVVHPQRRIAQVLSPDGEVDQLARIGAAPLSLADRQHHA